MCCSRSMTKSLQEIFAPAGRCFGCGPTNDKGLRIRSFALADTIDAHVVCDFTPELTAGSSSRRRSSTANRITPLRGTRRDPHTLLHPHPVRFVQFFLDMRGNTGHTTCQICSSFWTNVVLTNGSLLLLRKCDDG